MTLDAGSLTVNTVTDIELYSRVGVSIEATGELNLGSGGVEPTHPMVYGDQLAVEYNGHVHPTPLGPTSAPAAPLTAGVFSSSTKVS
jgi:hypothetical protein